MSYQLLKDAYFPWVFLKQSSEPKYVICLKETSFNSCAFSRGEELIEGGS